MDEDSFTKQIFDQIINNGKSVSGAIKRGEYDSMITGINGSDLNGDGTIAGEEIAATLANYEIAIGQLDGSVVFDVFPTRKVIETNCDAALNDQSSSAQINLHYAQQSFVAHDFLNHAVRVISSLPEESKPEAITQAAKLRAETFGLSSTSTLLNISYVQFEDDIIRATMERYQQDPEFRSLIEDAPSLAHIGNLAAPEFCNSALGKDVRDTAI